MSPDIARLSYPSKSLQTHFFSIVWFYFTLFLLQSMADKKAKIVLWFGYVWRAIWTIDFIGILGGEEEDGGGSSFVHGCKAFDIITTQAVGSPLLNGILTYSVQISSTCQLECRIWNLHGLFALAKLVNPRIFRQMGPNDCIVNDGKPLDSGVTLSFVYANSFSYPMAVAGAKMG